MQNFHRRPGEEGRLHTTMIGYRAHRDRIRFHDPTICKENHTEQVTSTRASPHRKVPPTGSGHASPKSHICWRDKPRSSHQFATNLHNPSRVRRVLSVTMPKQLASQLRREKHAGSWPTVATLCSLFFFLMWCAVVRCPMRRLTENVSNDRRTATRAKRRVKKQEHLQHRQSQFAAWTLHHNRTGNVGFGNRSCFSV